MLTEKSVLHVSCSWNFFSEIFFLKSDMYSHFAVLRCDTCILKDTGYEFWDQNFYLGPAISLLSLVSVVVVVVVI